LNREGGGLQSPPLSKISGDQHGRAGLGAGAVWRTCEKPFARSLATGEGRKDGKEERRSPQRQRAEGPAQGPKGGRKFWGAGIRVPRVPTNQPAKVDRRFPLFSSLYTTTGGGGGR